MRDIGYEVGNHRMIVQAYRSLGAIYKERAQYEVSIVCFKKILVYAWVKKEKEMEIEAMRNLAFLYFYQGDLKEAQIYLERAMRGIFEADHSHAKRIAILTHQRQQKSRDLETHDPVRKDFGLKKGHDVKVTRDGPLVILDFTSQQTR
jgi:tetratricopeptide (TPR) repeat protein